MHCTCPLMTQSGHSESAVQQGTSHNWRKASQPTRHHRHRSIRLKERCFASPASVCLMKPWRFRSPSCCAVEGIPAEAKETETLSISKLFSLERKTSRSSVSATWNTRHQRNYTTRRVSRRKAAGVPTLVCIFNEAGQTSDGDPQQLPESVEFLQGSLSEGIKRVSEILFQSRIDSKPHQPALDEGWMKCPSRQISWRPSSIVQRSN